MALALISLNIGVAAVRFTDEDNYDVAVLERMER